MHGMTLSMLLCCNLASNTANVTTLCSSTMSLVLNYLLWSMWMTFCLLVPLLLWCTSSFKPEYFLGIEVKYLPSGSVILTQFKYIQDLLQRANMLSCSPMATPMVVNVKLSKQGTDTLPDPTQYRSLVGALQYITLTRPELSYSVNKVCRFLSRPLETHWKAVKHILRYLSHTIHYGLLL